MLLFMLFSVSDFFTFWFIIELIMLTLIGFSFTLFLNRVSQLMVYFFIQSISSFVILVSYVMDFSFLFSLALIVKLGMFPVYTWYVRSLVRFPNFVLYIASTLHKLPPLLILTNFNLMFSPSVFWFSIVRTVFVSGFLILSSQDLRYLLVLSSVGNNSWLLLSQLVSVSVIVSYWFVYSLLLFFLLYYIGYFFSSSNFSFFPNLLILTSLSGLPPFPLFFVKILVLYGLFSLGYNVLLLLVLLFNSLMVSAYIIYTIKLLVYRSSSPFSTVLSNSLY